MYKLCHRQSFGPLLNPGCHAEVKNGSRKGDSAVRWLGKTASANDPRILEYYVADGERSGRPKEISDEVEEGQLADVRGSRSDISLASCAYL